ncbi:MAG TPA: glycoside hydrolase family 3 N-terminal domain-containing protein, partial [Candidatus Methylacidiphilales bacterium]
ALEGSALGFNWTLAPVCDLALEIDSPVVAQRAAGRTPEAVVPIVTGYIRGLQEHGMAATAKHFPGDGFATIDQHLATPVNRMTRAEWEATYGRTFSAAIRSGVSCIMPGHIGLSWIEPAPADKHSRGEPPATVSKRILTDLLRNQMGFEGVIVSDAMCMGGVAGYMNYYEACAAFLEAGGDCLLFVRYDAHFEKGMERCLRQGLLREETLLRSASRLLALKERFGLLSGSAAPKKEAAPREASRAVSETLSRECIEIVRDRRGILPVEPAPGLKVLHLCICSEYANPDVRAKLDRFTDELARHAGHVACWSDPGSEKVFHSLQDKEFDLVVVSLWSQADYAVNVVRLHGPIARNLMDGWMHLGVPVVFVAHAYPFHHHHYRASMDTVINTYQSTLDSVRFAADGIFGAIELPRAEE